MKRNKTESDNKRKAYKDQNGRWKDKHGHLVGYEVHGDSHN
jgi:hypothetical protein